MEILTNADSVKQTLYSLNMTLGTPEQDFQVNIDTGSSDLWVNAPDSRLCSRVGSPCDGGGTYNANASSTYNYVGSWFNISYVDGSGASGDYATDTMSFSDHTIKNFQFGIGYNSSSPQNIRGIGYPLNEAQVTAVDMHAYKNLPARLASDGTIASRSFSMWLNDLDAGTGNLLFGGVDRAQYRGDLVSRPIQRANSDVPHTEFYITLNSVDLDGENLGSDLALAVLVDSGTTLTYLPDDMTATIYDAVNARFDKSQGSALVPCSLGRQSANMTFRFSDPAVIEVPIDEMVLDVLSDTGDATSYAEDSQRACLFGIAPSDGGSAVLGDTFLRSAYVVFDMDNNEVAIAQSRLNATDTDIVEIGAGDSAVPSAVDATGSVQATDGLPSAPDATGEGGGGGDEDGVAGLEPSWGGLMGAMVLSFLVGVGELCV